MLYRKESWIDAMGKTKEGQDVLKTIWRLQQTEPDEAAIAAFSGRSVSE